MSVSEGVKSMVTRHVPAAVLHSRVPIYGLAARRLRLVYLRGRAHMHGVCSDIDAKASAECLAGWCRDWCRDRCAALLAGQCMTPVVTLEVDVHAGRYYGWGQGQSRRAWHMARPQRRQSGCKSWPWLIGTCPRQKSPKDGPHRRPRHWHTPASVILVNTGPAHGPRRPSLPSSSE